MRSKNLKVAKVPYGRMIDERVQGRPKNLMSKEDEVWIMCLHDNS